MVLAKARGGGGAILARGCGGVISSVVVATARGGGGAILARRGGGFFSLIDFYFGVIAPALPSPAVRSPSPVGRSPLPTASQQLPDARQPSMRVSAGLGLPRAGFSCIFRTSLSHVTEQAGIKPRLSGYVCWLGGTGCFLTPRQQVFHPSRSYEPFFAGLFQGMALAPETAGPHSCGNPRCSKSVFVDENHYSVLLNSTTEKHFHKMYQQLCTFFSY